jgi:uncharacterized protein YwgA
MDSRHVVLKLFVEELGQAAAIDNFEDRKTFQKAVYLGQVAGVDLGYRYSWYLKGPYSRGLARDYYELTEAIQVGERGFERRSLNPSVKARLRRIRPLFNVPANVQLSQADWLELLASWHYLRAISRLNDREARLIMDEKKPVLSRYIPAAQRSLEQHRLLT